MAELLSDDAVRTALETLPGWRRDGDALVRDVQVPEDSRDALKQGAMNEAERMNHHPEIEDVGDLVRFRLTTHDAGGITPNDVELAASIDKVISGAGTDEGPEGP